MCTSRHCKKYIQSNLVAISELNVFLRLLVISSCFQMTHLYFVVVECIKMLQVYREKKKVKKRKPFLVTISIFLLFQQNKLLSVISLLLEHMNIFHYLYDQKCRGSLKWLEKFPLGGIVVQMALVISQEWPEEFRTGWYWCE